VIDLLRPELTVEPRPKDPETSRYVRSYLIMRVFVGALGVALPFLVVLVDGLAFDGDPFPRTSLSAYYYSGARELFVGTLSATAIFLVTYKVADRTLDNTLSTLAGVAVLVVALFPTGLPPDVTELTPLQDLVGESVVEVVHFGAAAVFIVSLAAISFTFGVRAGAIAVALVWIVVTELFGGPPNSLLYGEAVSVWAFGASWLMKGLELDILRASKPSPRPPGDGTASQP